MEWMMCITVQIETFFLVSEPFPPWKKIEWQFNEAHHGKGPMDGVGGTIKNKVFREVKSGRFTITSPKKFSNAAERLVSKIVSIYLSINEIIEDPSYVKDSPIITNTLKIYTFPRKIHKNAILLSWIRSISCTWTIPLRILQETGKSNFVWSWWIINARWKQMWSLRCQLWWFFWLKMAAMSIMYPVVSWILLLDKLFHINFLRLN